MDSLSRNLYQLPFFEKKPSLAPCLAVGGASLPQRGRELGRKVEPFTSVAGPSIWGRSISLYLRQGRGSRRGRTACAQSKMLPAEKAPVFDREALFSLVFGQQPQSRMTNMGPSRRAGSPLSQMNSTARRMCVAAAGDHTANNGVAERIAKT